MPRTLAALRRGLEVVPSPDPNEPGLVLRDPYRYTDQAIFVPPPWTVALGFLDGEHTDLDVQEALTRATGELVFGETVRQFEAALQEQGFLETAEFRLLRDAREAEFRAQPERLPIYAGNAYPADAAGVRSTLRGYFAELTGPAALSPRAVGVAAPHVSPEGGGHCYAAAYRALATLPGAAERTFVVLGTSHYGAAEKFGVTRKPFVTPLGTLPVNLELVDWLEEHAGEAVTREDYCFAIEHSIEFQCLFLQYALGRNVKILPILCGAFAESLQTGCPPEDNLPVARFLAALAELARTQGDRLFWVLGIDLAHVGRRYGGDFNATANRGIMATVADRDRQRLEAFGAGDLAQFFAMVKTDGDDLNWCGYSPLYTFAKAIPQARGRVLRYEQWNIDPQSVVTFAGLEFFLTPESSGGR
jgi:hypothetical protein